MSDVADDPVDAFYERHPYPPPVDELGDRRRQQLTDDRTNRYAHHVIWPRRSRDRIERVLVAGCGTSQAVRWAVRHLRAQVTGIDVSPTSIRHTRELAERERITNLTVHRLPIERADELGERYDHIVCTGVLHHLADPSVGLTTLGRLLAPGGALTLMVYAPFGRAGVYLIQEYCRIVGVEPTADGIADLVATLRELPPAHPIAPLLRSSPDFADDDALADALLNPRDRAYSVPELFELIEGAGLVFGRWQRQAPYLVACGSLGETPHRDRIASLDPIEAFAAAELFRGTMTRHTAVLHTPGGDDDAHDVRTADDGGSWVPVVAPTATIVRERLPRGAAAALINRAHSDSDLVMFVDRRDLRAFEAIDGVRTVGQMGAEARPVLHRLWQHDLVAFDATGRSDAGGDA